MNFALFAVGAGIVCFCATKLTKYLDVISERTGMGKAFAGILLLGIATSLPEIATTGVAAYGGQSQLATSNLMGGVAIQITVLAFIDLFALRGKALTSRSPNAALLMQGVILILVIGMAIMAFASGEIFQVFSVGFWSAFIFLTYVVGLFAVHRYEGDPRWEPVEKREKDDHSEIYKEKMLEKFSDTSTTNLVVRFIVMGIGVLIGGFFVTKSAEKIVELTGVSSSIVGATLLAFATSLPEVMTTWSAVRLGAYVMAIGSILGTNTLEVGLLLPADIFYREGSIIDDAGMNSIFLAGLGMVVTCLYLWGILERRDKTIFRMGVDSFLIIIVYFAGMAVFSFTQK